MHELARPARFLAVGLVATATQFAVLAAGTSWLGLPASVSSGAGYLAGSVVGYVMNYSFTFRSTQPHQQAVPRFYAMVAVAWLMTIALMALMVDWLAWNKWVSQVLVTAVCLVFNYTSARTWVFKATSP